MAQTATNPKIEELRFRLKTDPKSRIFYQLAEELRKSGSVDEAEQVLRSGLAVYPTYLAAWVSLGRVLRDRKQDAAAVEALSKAMQLDPGNVVAARLLGDAHLGLGDKLEAIKKYKLVLALMPGDEELKGTIDQLDRDLHPIAVSTETAPPPEADAIPQAGTASPAEAAIAPETSEDSPFDRTAPPFADAFETGDAEPMLAAHEESPFEEPATIAAALEIEQAPGMQIEAAPLAAEVPAPVVEEADVFEPVATEPATQGEDLANTLTMADLYERQGLTNDARQIYESLLTRDPENAEVRARLEAIAPHVNPKIDRLERWLTKVSKREVPGV
jgi:tetratricopeptide (TPR) repeat protein